MADPIYPTRTGIIYKITNTLNGKFYIGKTIYPLSHRWKQHQTSATKGSACLIHTALRKHGIQNFIAEVIDTVTNPSDLNNREIAAIREMKPQYNMTVGGDGLSLGFKHTADTKQKMSMSRSGKLHSPEHKINNSKAHTGKKHTMEAKRKMSIAKLGKKRPPRKQSLSHEMDRECLLLP